MFLSYFFCCTPGRIPIKKENIMELKKRSEFLRTNSGTLTALYQDQEDFSCAIEKTREEINRICP